MSKYDRFVDQHPIVAMSFVLLLFGVMVLVYSFIMLMTSKEAPIIPP